MYFCPKKSSTVSCGDVKCNFDRIVEKFLPKFEELFADIPKVMKRNVKVSKNPQNIHVDTYNAVFTSLLKFFRRKSEVFSLKIRRRRKFLFFSKYFFPQNLSFATQVAFMTDSAKNSNKNWIFCI